MTFMLLLSRKTIGMVLDRYASLFSSGQWLTLATARFTYQVFMSPLARDWRYTDQKRRLLLSVSCSDWFQCEVQKQMIVLQCSGCYFRGKMFYLNS